MTLHGPNDPRCTVCGGLTEVGCGDSYCSECAEDACTCDDSNTIGIAE